jgi:hypothetical protein
VYGKGRVYLFGSCKTGGTGKGEAQGELGANVFGLNLKIAEAYLFAEATNAQASVNAYIKVVGQTLWSYNKTQSLSIVYPSGSSENSPATVWSTSKSWQKSWTFYLGPVPVKITVSVNASIGLRLHLSAQLAPVQAIAVIQPYLTSSVSAQGGVAFSFGCSASAGVGASLTLLNDTLTAKAKAWLGAQGERCCLFYNYSIHNQVNALSGNVYAYAEACCWGLNGPKCGWGRRRQQWTYTLFSWPGYSSSGYWLNQSGQYCF